MREGEHNCGKPDGQSKGDEADLYDMSGQSK